MVYYSSAFPFASSNQLEFVVACKRRASCWSRRCVGGCVGFKQPIYKEETMKRNQLLSAVGIILFVAGSLAAQQKPGTLAGIEFQKPKNGMVPQYEAGRKQKAAWHKEKNDTQGLLVWETLTGDSTGTYLVSRFAQHWGDLDKPSIPDETDLAEYQKVIGTYGESMVYRLYDFMPKISNPPAGAMAPSKFSEISIFHVRYGKNSDFRSAIERIHDASEKTKWPVNYEWYALVNGGEGGEYVLSVPRNSWADFEDKPELKPFRDMLKEAFGQAEADSIVDRIDHSVEHETTEIIQFRPDLSYMPAK
jgi:hypothetical protein